jgi:hypothetical protein
VRLSKSVRLVRVRLEGHVDLYNALNGNTVTGITPQYGGSWLNATSIELGRLLKFGGQVNF